jgi:general secretion pathway protein F
MTTGPVKKEIRGLQGFIRCVGCISTLSCVKRVLVKKLAKGLQVSPVMPVYEYTALNEKGKKLKGIIDAQSTVAARQKLRESHIYLIDLQEAAGNKKDSPLKISAGSFFRKAGTREVTVMTRQLATLLGAGLPLVQSLTTLISQTSHPHLKTILSQIREEVNEGNSLSFTMTRYPQVFPAFYLNMVRAGEASGTLHLVLERLADFSEKQQALRGRVRAALAYPFFMFFVGSIVLFFLVTFVVPNVTKIFDEMHQTLPLITIILIGVSRFLETFWWVIVAGIIASVIALKYFLFRTERGRNLRDRILLRLPVIGSMNRRIAVARFSRTLGTLLESGVPLLASLEIVRNIVGNDLISDAIRKAGIDVREGQSLSAPLARSGLFPAISVEMISVGEQSGNLEPMLYRIADAYEKEVESNITLLTSLLEPVMILVMGLIVGFIVVSILLPIFEMNQLVR